MEEKDLHVSKFMKSMMESNKLGFKNDGDKQIKCISAKELES